MLKPLVLRYYYTLHLLNTQISHTTELLPIQRPTLSPESVPGIRVGQQFILTFNFNFTFIFTFILISVYLDMGKKRTF